MIRRLMAVALLLHAMHGERQRFTTSVDAVRVDALVMNGNRPVTGLSAADFELLDNGVPQQIDSISVGDVPVSVLVALDISQSVAGETFDRLQEAADAALALLQSGDRAALLTFSNEVRLRTDWTGEIPSARGALRKIVPGGETALFDATFAGLSLGGAVHGHRRLLLLFSDGADTASWLPGAAVVIKAERTDAVVYSVVRGDARWQPQTRTYRSGIRLSDTRERPAAAHSFVRELAEATGGQMFAAASTGDLRDAFTRIINEFRTRYLLTYTPRGVDESGWHRISVKVRNRSGTITARRGYLR